MTDTDLLEPLKEYQRALSEDRANGGLCDLRREGYVYANAVDWVLQHGRVMMPTD